MITNDVLYRILRETSLAMKHTFDAASLQSLEVNKRSYDDQDFEELKRDLIESARSINLLALEYAIQPSAIDKFIQEADEVVLVFKRERSELHPLLFRVSRGKATCLIPDANVNAKHLSSDQELYRNEHGDIIIFTLLPYKSFVSDYLAENSLRPLTPMRRLWRLLGTERKDIAYIFIYAFIIGVVSLALPLGLQTTVELISGGVFFSSIYVLIGLVIVGVLITGILQVVQISIVEHLQRRIFTKAAFEFSFRIPRIKMEALLKIYAPELVNRFFDVITIQKGLPKLLIDLSSAGIQILFGVLLLSLYHPFFVFFSFFLILVLALIIYFTGERGLASSINESKYKYKIVQWLEELARAINSFKLGGNTSLPIRRTDYTVSNYLKYRKAHFSVLITQFSSFVFFKVAVTGGLLIMGTILVINREITLGQFVASEVIIILVLNAVEKIIMYTDVVYDMLTAVDKVSHLTDLPLERSGGIDFSKKSLNRGYEVSIQNLYYSFKDSTGFVLDDINLSIEAGERVCISGPGGSGKSTLVNIITGLQTDYTGGVSINGLSLRDLDLTHLRDKVAKNISPEDLFDGTVYENLTMGRQTVMIDDLTEVLSKVGLKEFISALPLGLQTHVLSGGKGFSNTVIHQLILARCLAKQPHLLILNDFFYGLSKTDKLQLIRCVINPEDMWTMVAVSNDPLVMAACDRVIVMDGGKIVADGSYQNLLKSKIIDQYFE